MSGSIVRAARHPHTPSVRKAAALALVNPAPVVAAADLTDAESQRVLAAAARTVAFELGREAAREYFAALIDSRDAPR